MSKLSTPISFIALIISFVSFMHTCSSYQENTKFDTVQKTYQVYFDLGRIALERWQLSHLLTLPDRYEEISEQIRVSVRPLTPQKQAEYLLQERALADYIFTLYEQTVYQWDYTKSKERAFLQEILNYLTDRLLRNPRLLWYWSEDGGGLSSNYEELTRRHYKTNVLENPANNLKQKPDRVGPFKRLSK